MKIKKCIMTLIFTMIMMNSVAGKEKVNAPAPDVKAKPAGKIIVLFPFYNFSGSGLKYLSSYIPELINKKINAKNKITVLGTNDINDALRKNGITPKSIYDNKESFNLLPELNAHLYLIGRYIIFEKTMRIDYRIIDLNLKNRIKKETLDLKMDDSFLSTLNIETGKIGQWVQNKILERKTVKKVVKVNIFKKYFNKLKNSKAGIIIKNRWLFSLIILVVFFLLSKIIVLFFEKVLKRITSKTAITMDEKIVDMSKKPAKWIVIFFGIKFAIFVLKINPRIDSFLVNLTSGIIIILTTYIIFNIVELLIHSWGNRIASKINSRIDDDLVPLFVKMAKVIVISIGIIMVLSGFNIDIAPLIASLGIAGFAIGFAVKDSLSNIIGGIVLILDQSFAVGDKVTIDGDTGIIKEIGLRNTKIQTFDNEIIVIPNGDLMNKKFKNAVLPDPKIRVVVNFTVSYGTDVDKVEETILKAISKLSDICEDPAPAVVFIEMADFSLNFQAKLWVPDYVNQYSKWVETTKVVYNTLVDAGFSIPFPTHTVYIEKNE